MIVGPGGLATVFPAAMLRRATSIAATQSPRIWWIMNWSVVSSWSTRMPSADSSSRVRVSSPIARSMLTW